MDSHERTFIMIKPDGVQRGLVGKIIERFESRGLKLVALKFKVATQELLAEHYKEHVLKPFYKGLADYMASGPVVCMVWEGSRAVAVGRAMLGATKPIDSAPGTIRGDFCLEVGRNLCHGSDSVDSAKREIGLWFEEKEIISWKAANHEWVFEQ